MMFGPYDRPTFDQSRQHLDAMHAPPGAGLVQFRVVEYYEDRHSALITLPEFNNLRMEVRCPALGTNGPGTSHHFRPIPGTEGQGVFKQGRSAMYGGKFEILHYNNSREMNPPEHPDLKGQQGAFVQQMGLQHDDGTVEPSTMRVMRNDGGITEVTMGQHIHQKEHATDERTVGPSLTTSEAMAVSTANKLYKAVQTADRMLEIANNSTLEDPEDLNEISRGFDTMANRLDSAHIDGANSASTFANTIQSQGDAAGIGANAAGLAAGNGDYSSLG